MPQMFRQYLKFFVLWAILCLLSGCSVTQYQKQGYAGPENFHYKTTFIPYKSCVVLPAVIGNDTLNFLFDTGCQITLIQKDSTSGGNMEVTGASNKTINLGQVIIDVLKIGDVTFHNTNAAGGNYVGLKEKIPNFGGLIGQPVISKANWLIDYTKNTIEISSEDLSDSSFEIIPIRVKNGSPFTWITIDGKKHKVLIDLGSSKGMSIPQNAEPADEIIQKYHFQENEREVYRIGGLETLKEHIGNIPVVQIGDIVFNDVETSVVNTNKIRIGNSFFKDYILYIDNTHKCCKIKRIKH
jgi:hypothetical protein